MRARPTKAARASSAGVSCCGRSSPGAGGRKLKSGGTDNGAGAATANSSGTVLSRPSARLVLLQPDRATVAAITMAATASALPHVFAFIQQNPLDLSPMVGAGDDCVKQPHARADGDTAIGQIKSWKRIVVPVKQQEVGHHAD